MSVGDEQRPLRVAIVGSGPAGIYAAAQLLGREEVRVAVDLFDRLATPWGLVRFGVAPDHPKIKSVTRAFEKTAQRPGFRFFGNVEVGSDLSHTQLMSAYDAVIYSVGTASDRRLGVPGEDLPGSVAATDFVAWYNGHPDYADAEFDLSGERAVVVGNGNVALDVARMLALSAEELGATDTADHAIAALAASEITEIVVLGRRGPAQAAFTNPELRELADLELADVIVDVDEATLDPASEAALEAASATAKRNVATLGEYVGRTPSGKPRRIVLRFLVSPLAIEGDERVEAVTIVRNELVERDGALRPRATQVTERIEAGLVLRSVGYIGTPLDGVPFDAEALRILNDDGRVLDPDDRTPLPGVYTAGWIKRGPSGVIGTNKKCATQTVAHLFEDLEAGRLPTPSREPDELIAELRERDHAIVEYDGWQAIDAHERAAGEPAGRPRVKLVSRAEQLAVAAGAGAGR